MNSNGGDWELSPYGVYECIWCDGKIKAGDEVLTFPNPCCEMGGLSICKACLFEAHGDYDKFKDEVG